MSSQSSEIIIVTNESQLAENVRQALAGESRFVPGRTCRDYLELIAHLERQPAAAAVVDIDPNPRARLADLDPVIVRFPDTRFVLVAASPQSDLVVEAMQVGARHLLSKDAIGSQLAAVLGRLLPHREGAARASGAMVTVLSAGGGCGATSLAINMAAEFQAIHSTSVLLVDLDLAFGGLALTLGLSGQYGIADVLAHGTAADPELIRSSAVDAGPLSVLLSPASSRFAESATPAWQNLASALVACKLAYGCTIIDAPRVPMAAAATLAAASSATLIVMQLCVKDIHIARALRQGLLDHGVPAERLVSVVNRYHRRRAMVSVEQAQRAMQANHFQMISNDYPAVSRGINYGQTLAAAAPRSVVRKDIRELLDRLALPGPTSVSAGSSS